MGKGEYLQEKKKNQKGENPAVGEGKMFNCPLYITKMFGHA